MFITTHLLNRRGEISRLYMSGTNHLRSSLLRENFVVRAHHDDSRLAQRATVADIAVAIVRPQHSPSQPDTHKF